MAMAFWVRGPRHCAWNDPLVWRSWHLDLTGWRFQEIYEALTFHIFSYFFIFFSFFHIFHICSYLFISFDMLIRCWFVDLLLLLLDAMLKNRPKPKKPKSSLQGPEETRERVAILVLLADLTVEKMVEFSGKPWENMEKWGKLWLGFSENHGVSLQGNPASNGHMRFFMGI